MVRVRCCVTVSPGVDGGDEVFHQLLDAAEAVGQFPAVEVAVIALAALVVETCIWQFRRDGAVSGAPCLDAANTSVVEGLSTGDPG